MDESLKWCAAFLMLLTVNGAVKADGTVHRIETSDGLIAFIKSDDRILRTLGSCTGEKLSRDGHSFTYTGECETYPDVASDCPSYRVEARGTVDTPTVATVREISLVLQCYS